MTVVLEEMTVVSKESTVVPEETPVVPEETPVVPEETPVVPEETPVVPEETPVVPEETSVVPEETPIVPEETPVVPEETPVVPEETPVVPEEMPVVPEETPVVPEETPVVPEETPVVFEETPVVPEETPVVPEETPVVPEETYVVPEEPMHRSEKQHVRPGKPCAGEAMEQAVPGEEGRGGRAPRGSRRPRRDALRDARLEDHPSAASRTVKGRVGAGRPARPAGETSEAHRNRTCPRQRNCPAPILKTGGGTSRPRASAGGSSWTGAKQQARGERPASTARYRSRSSEGARPRRRARRRGRPWGTASSPGRRRRRPASCRRSGRGWRRLGAAPPTRAMAKPSTVAHASGIGARAHRRGDHRELSGDQGDEDALGPPGQPLCRHQRLG